MIDKAKVRDSVQGGSGVCKSNGGLMYNLDFPRGSHCFHRHIESNLQNLPC